MLGDVDVGGDDAVPAVPQDLDVAYDGGEAGAEGEPVHVDEVEVAFLELEGGDDAVVVSFLRPILEALHSTDVTLLPSLLERVLLSVPGYCSFRRLSSSSDHLPI